MEWGVLTMVSYCRLSFGCHVAGSDVAPGFHYWALVVFVVVAAVSVRGGVRLCSFWGVCCCLGSRSLSGHSDDDERRIRIRRSSSGCHVAVSDVAPGICVSKEKGS